MEWCVSDAADGRSFGSMFAINCTTATDTMCNSYTPFIRGSIHEANIIKIHVHDMAISLLPVCLIFASCLLRVL